MTTVISTVLRKPANVFQAGESTGFGINFGVKCQHPKTKEDAYANYSAVIFAKSPAQIDFYQRPLVEGAIVTISCEKLCPEMYEGQSGTGITLNMLNARIVNVFNQDRANQGNQQPAPQQPVPQQNPNQPPPPPQGQPMGAYQAPMHQAPQQPMQNNQFSDQNNTDIPF